MFPYYWLIELYDYTLIWISKIAQSTICFQSMNVSY